MQLATGWRRFALVFALLTAALSPALLGAASVSAQESTTHQFYGFSGDVTIDGEPLGPGSVIVAMVDDVEIGRTTVNQAGAWILDVDSGEFSKSPCNVSFVIDGHHVDPEWETCALRVRLAVTTADGAADGAALEAEESDDDLLMAEDEGAEADSLEERQIVRPSPPRTGTGGVLAAQSSTDRQSSSWPSAAAITALLMVGAALAALVVSRRTDAST